MKTVNSTQKSTSFLVLMTIAIMALVLSSCTADDEINLQNQTSEALLENYEIRRNADGSYYVNYEVKGASSDNIKDKDNVTNNIMLYPDNTKSNKVLTEDIGFVSSKEEFRINFNDTQINKVTSITVKDNDIKFARNENRLLAEYNFQSNGDGTYNLDFTVKKNVQVEFVYNDELESYDILLSEGNADQSEYLRTFTPDANGNLRIAFVTSSVTNKLEAERKPEIIVGG